MADFKPTPSQRAAIGSRGETVLVSAGAGSGKTRVLTERLIAAVRGPGDSTDIDRFLVITFTRAAAGELKSRITQELAKALAADPGNRRLRRQSSLCRKAQIGTIHSFCGALLREYSHVFALPPDFRIIEEERSAAMRASALERTLEQWYERADEHPGFLLLADTAGAGRDDRALSELVLSLHKKMQSHARPELWAAGQAALLQKPWTDAAETPWGRELCAWAADTAALWSGSLDALIAEAQRCGNPKQIEFYTDALGGTADGLRELLRAIPLGWDRARACFPIPWADFRGAPRGGDRALAARVSRSRELLKKTLDKLQAAFDAPSDKLLDELRGCAGPMGALLELTLAFDKRYAADKQRQGLADYADLEHMAARLLTNPDGSPTDTARRVAERYDELLVDEYQDVSPVQDAIFSALAACGVRRFLVGDVKQSVYRFRLADPSLFTRRYERYPLDADASSPEAARKILLRENFRSRREIIDGVNAVFSRCMSRALGDLDYDEEAALIFGAQGYTGEVPPPELLLLDLRSGGADDDETPDDLIAEAAFVARSIKKLVEAGTPVQGADGPRPMDYGDAAILLRAANSIGPVYRRALAAEGVPVAAGQGVGYYSSVEISTALSLLAVIDNPHQDISLIAALRSPVFGFTADELSAIRAADRDADFYTALTAAAANDEKCRAFLARIEPLRSLSADLSAEDLVWELLDGFDLLAIYSAMSDGAQRRLNLLELAELARRFESGGYRGLHRFVRWLRSLAERGEEPAPAGGSGQAVQIWSIHKSKGLEFPVVFLCDQARRFNKRDGSETVPVHPDLGLGPKVVDLERRVSYPSLARRAIARRLEQETLSEELRLLYVALTRAKERLFVTAGLKKPEEALEKLAQPPCGKLPAELLSAQSAPVGWLIAAVLADGERHWRLRVVTPG
ncbi:MAG: UvrD-helicase domain-containing protein, partial [Oscillospiraceae bacterium]|nr:UvrD-helicase domain-containing protein [Oscillospiraceae bacterium]